jgi:hypothetical protein
MRQRKKLCVTFVLLIIAAFVNCGTAFAAGQTDCDNLKTYVAGLEDATFGWPVHDVTTTWNAATATIPEYCQVKGWMWPQLQFQVSLPTTWNKRQIHFGGGGWDGTLGGPTDSVATTLTLGYAYDSSNGGWDSTANWPNAALGGIFGLKDPYFRMDWPTYNKDNPNSCQMVVDFGIRAHRESPMIARKIINHYYGSYPKYTYYSGTSCGGKEGMVSTQKMYDLYDGFFFGSPLGGHMAVTFRGMWNTVKNAGLAVPVGKGTVYSVYKAALHYKTVYDKCDGVDGLVDGLIDDPRKCNFNALTDLPACTEAQEKDGTGTTSTTCFTLAQRQGLADTYAGPHDSKGNALYPGATLGSEWVLASGSVGFSSNIADARAVTMFQYIALDPPPGPTYDGTKFDWDKDTKTMQQTTCTQCYEGTGKCVKYNIHNTVDAITISPSPQPNMGGLAPLKKKGAKIIQYHGWADPLVSPLAASVNYYENALKTFGAAGTKSFYKLYMSPGMGHSRGGLGVEPAWKDAFGALVNWVENHVEPTSIPGSRAANTDANFPLARTRPNCFYPEVARWDGEGSIEDAANFSCVPPIDVKFSPSTISLGNAKGILTATITVPTGYNMKDWNLGTLTCEGASMKAGSQGGQTYTVKFNVKDLTGVATGTATLTVKGQFTKSGKSALVQASNTVKVTK